MTWHMFERHMAECHILVHDSLRSPEHVYIRTADGDCELAAVHRLKDGKTLILDLGSPVKGDTL